MNLEEGKTDYNCIQKHRKRKRVKRRRRNIIEVRVEVEVEGRRIEIIKRKNINIINRNIKSIDLLFIIIILIMSEVIDLNIAKKLLDKDLLISQNMIKSFQNLMKNQVENHKQYCNIENVFIGVKNLDEEQMIG